MKTYQELETYGAPIKAWTCGVPVEDIALKQLQNVARLPFVHEHVAVMPDVHWGRGATVGSVIPCKGAIVPAAVGVDIGCGMMAVRTTLGAVHLPDNLAALRTAIERAVPHGRTAHGGPNDRGAWSTVPARASNRWQNEFAARYDALAEKHRPLRKANTVHHLGTLGTGNHFIELCLDEEGMVWVMLHSGSRGIGNKIGTYFIDRAKREMERYHIGEYLPDKDLSYLVEHSEVFDDYIEAVSWAQEFAMANREVMMTRVLEAMRKHLPKFQLGKQAVNCHHNYVALENHFGANVWVTRKGAVRAREGDLGIIPGSMGERSFIVRGKGNANSFHSCSHGAGRVMSRGEAKRTFTLADHRAATEGVECRKDKDVIDETPGAYKDIDAVMAAQAELVDVEHTLKQVLCVKG